MPFHKVWRRPKAVWENHGFLIETLQAFGDEAVAFVARFAVFKLIHGRRVFFMRQRCRRVYRVIHGRAEG